MKKFTILLLLIVFTVPFLKAQTVDTLPSSIQINPVVVNAIKRDTAFQLTWLIMKIGRDTTKGCEATITMYNRKKWLIFSEQIYIPAEVIKRWGTDDTLIDDYVLNFYSLTRRL